MTKRTDEEIPQSWKKYMSVIVSSKNYGQAQQVNPDIKAASFGRSSTYQNLTRLNLLLFFQSSMEMMMS